MNNIIENKIKDWAELYTWKNYLLALEEMRTLLEKSPDNPLLIFLYAATLLKTGKYNDAKEIFNKLVTLLKAHNIVSEVKDKEMLNKIIQVSQELISKIDKRDYSFPEKNPIEWIKSGLKEDVFSIATKCKDITGIKTDIKIIDDVKPETKPEEKYTPIFKPEQIESKFPSEENKEDIKIIEKSKIPPSSKIPPPITPVYQKDAKITEKPESKFTIPEHFLRRSPESIKKEVGKPFEPYKSTSAYDKIKESSEEKWHSDTASILSSMQEEEQKQETLTENDFSSTYTYKRKKNNFDTKPSAYEKNITEIMKFFYTQEIIAFVITFFALLFNNNIMALVGVILSWTAIKKAKKAHKIGKEKEKTAALAFISLIIGIIVLFK